MSWFYLVVASMLEAVWALGLPKTEGFTRLVPTVWVLLAMAGSFILLAQATRTIPASTAYAVWVALGVAFAVIAEALFLGRSGNSLRWVFLVLLIVSVVGLKLTGPSNS